MKHYIHKDEGVVLLSELPENIGYTSEDYKNGYYIELSDEQVELTTHTNDFDLIFKQKYYYLKKNIGVVVLDAQLNSVLYPDYVQMTDVQIRYWLTHPNATYLAIANCDNLVIEPELDIEQIRKQKLNELEQYDNSDEVNQFYVNGVGAWFEPGVRSNYTSSINSAKLLGVETLTFYVGDVALTVPVTLAEQMLAAVQLYADQCFIITKQHQIAINNLTSIDGIENYNFKAGYPEKLQFNI